jgi:predicted nucleotidyltransferase
LSYITRRRPCRPRGRWTPVVARAARRLTPSCLATPSLSCVDPTTARRYDSLVTAPALDVDEIRTAALRAFAPFHPHRIILFGSHAAGTADMESDVDLIVVYNTDKRFLERLEELYTAWPLPKAVDILAYTPEEYSDLLSSRPFVQDVVAAGLVLYERS